MFGDREDRLVLTRPQQLFLIGLGIAQILTVGAGLGTHMYLLRLPGALVPFLRVSEPLRPWFSPRRG